MKRHEILISLGLLVLCVGAYGNSLTNPFMMDDHAMITENRAIADPGFLQLNPYSKKSAALDIRSHVYFRPATHVLNWLTYSLFGTNVFGYHAFNLALFYLACLALYQMLYLLFGSRRAALMTSVLFCLHPINGVLVNYINSSGFSLLILSILLSIISCILYLERNKRACLMLSLFWFFISLLCHETAVAFPLYLITALYVGKHLSIKESLKRILPHLALLACYLVFRLSLTGAPYSLLSHAAGFQLSLPSYMATFSKLIKMYLYSLLSLRDIVLMRSVEPVTSHLALRVSAFCLALALAAFLIKYFGRKSPKKSFGLIWFLIGLLPVALGCFSRPEQGIIIEPHWLFFSTIGFLTLLSSCIISLGMMINSGRLAVIIACLIGFYYLAVSHQYNRLWSNERLYCREMLRLSPNMPLPAFWMGSSYLRDGRYKEARHYFLKALSSNRSDWEIYTNLGLIANKLDDEKAELDYYLKAWRLNPYAAPVYNNLGSILVKRNDLKRAEAYFNKAVELDYYLIEARKNLANIYLLTGRPQKAAMEFRNILNILPQDEYSRKALKGVKNR